MYQTTLLRDTLKKELRRGGITYRDVAHSLGLSESRVKRLFLEKSFTLQRMVRICAMAGMEISDLVRIAERSTPLTTQITLRQEQELVSDIELLLMAHFLVSRWSFSEIINTYAISETKGITLLAKLDRMKLIELLPGNRVKLMISRNFDWIEDGPIQHFFNHRVRDEFLESAFAGDGEFKVFLSGMLTQTSNAELVRQLRRVPSEFNQASVKDEAYPLHSRKGTSLMIAMRPWGAEVFESFRRTESSA